MTTIEINVVEAVQKVIHEQFRGNRSAFAKSMERTPQSIYQLLNRKRSPTVGFIAQFVKQYDINANYLFGRSKNLYNAVKTNP